MNNIHIHIFAYGICPVPFPIMKSVFFFVSLFFCYFYSFSQTNGCYSTSSNYIYVDRDGSANGVPNYKFDDLSDRYIQNSNVYCIRYSAANTCYITVPVNSNAYNSPNNFRSNFGTYVTFTVTQCPIDDYIWFPLLSFAFGGFIILRKSNLLLMKG